MANVISTRFEFHVQDTGYVIRTDRYDDGSEQQDTVPVNEPATPVAVTNFAGLITKARNALNANQNYLAIANPTNAQNAAQVQALTRQVDALIYYLLHELTGLNATPGV